MDRELGVEPLDGGDRERVDKPDVRALEAGAVDPERRVVELPRDFSAGRRPVRAGGGRGFCGGLDDVVGEAVGEVAVRRGLLEEGEDSVLRVGLVELAEAADGGADVVGEAAGREEDAVVLGCLGFTVRVGSEEGPANSVQWVRQK